MSELEDKLGAVLSNPQLMGQIMALARNLEQPPREQTPKEQPAQEPPPASTPSVPALALDPGLMQKIAGLTAGGVDENQQALLSALSPYLSPRRVEKLEKAMRAARMTLLASTFLGSGALPGRAGR